MINSAKSCLVRLCVIAAAFFSNPALSQDFPNRPIRLIVNQPPGSSTDLISRMIAADASTRLKQPIVVENRAGAGGLVGTQALKQAPPDGYTIGLVVSGNVIQTWMRKEMPFDIRSDFSFLTTLFRTDYVLIVPSSFPAKNLAEFVAYAKANPTKVFYGSSGVGTTTHLAAERFKQAAAIELAHVPFKGSPEAHTAMLGGAIHAYFDVYGSAKAQLEAGKVVAIGVTGTSRMPQLPNVPAISEAFPGYQAFAWITLAAPKGTPKPALDRLAAELRASFRQPEIHKQLVEGRGVTPGGEAPEDTTLFVNAELERWGQVIRAARLEKIE